MNFQVKVRRTVISSVVGNGVVDGKAEQRLADISAHKPGRIAVEEKSKAVCGKKEVLDDAIKFLLTKSRVVEH